MGSFSQRAHIRIAILAGVLAAVHVGDDYFRDDLPYNGTLFGLAVLVGLTAYAFGLLWSWSRETIGYWVVLVLGLLVIFWGGFLSHVLGAGADSISEIASTSGGWGPVMATASVLAGVLSLVTAILAVYFIVRPEARSA